MSILRKNEKYLKSTMISVDSLELEIDQPSVLKIFF